MKTLKGNTDTPGGAKLPQIKLHVDLEEAHNGLGSETKLQGAFL